jgi:hypothetical protein
MSVFKALSLPSAMFLDNLQGNGKRREPRKREIRHGIFFLFISRGRRGSQLALFSHRQNRTCKELRGATGSYEELRGATGSYGSREGARLEWRFLTIDIG